MTKLFVGQRVRVVGSRWLGVGESPTGMDGVIMHEGVVGDNTGVEYDWAVDVGRMRVAANSEDLEPILPDGHRAGDFSTVQELMDSLRRKRVPSAPNVHKLGLWFDAHTQY